MPGRRSLSRSRCWRMNVAIDRSFLDPVQLALDPRGRHAFHARLHGRRAGHHLRAASISRLGPAAGLVNAALIAWLAPAGWTSPLAIIAATLAIGLARRRRERRRDRVAPRALDHRDAWLLSRPLGPDARNPADVRRSGARLDDCARRPIGVFPLPLLIPARVFLAWAPVRALGLWPQSSGVGRRAARGLRERDRRRAERGLSPMWLRASSRPSPASPSPSLSARAIRPQRPRTRSSESRARCWAESSLSGGRGGLLGAAAGGAVLFLVQNLLSLAHVSAFYAQIAYGVILLASARPQWPRRERAPSARPRRQPSFLGERRALTSGAEVAFDHDADHI